MSLYVLGDPHFSALQPWRLPLGNSFLSWFKTFQPQAKKDCSLLVLGDFSDDAVNPGEVVKQIKEFAMIAQANFSQVFFLVGNHDLKLYKNYPQLSIEFTALEGINILRKPAEVLDIEGLHILSLPHYGYRNDIPSMWDHYANLPDEIKNQHFNVTFGHFSDTSAQLFDHVIDISYLNTDYVCLGHQHTRMSDHYAGSIFPCKISENNSPTPRAVWVFEKTDKGVSKKEIPLPLFGEYRIVDYPKALPKTKADITIWTVLGCETEKLAKEYYGDIYIRGVTLGSPKKNTASAAVSDDTFIMDNPVDILNDWIKTAKNPTARPVVTLLRKILAPPDPTVP